MLPLLLLPMMHSRIHEVPLCPQVLYHLPTCLPLPYITVTFPQLNLWWRFYCIHWWLCLIRVHVPTVLAVESLLGWGMKIWFPKDRVNLIQKTETCLLSLVCLSKFFLSFALNIILPSSELQWIPRTLWWKVLLKSSSTGLQRSSCICWQTRGCCCTILSGWI